MTILRWAHGDRTPDTDGLEPWLTPGEEKKETEFLYSGIAVSGKIASGKTTLARYVAAKYNMPIYSLARALKEDVTEALYMAGLAQDRSDIMNMKSRLRTIYQEWGALFREVNGEDYWVSRLFKEATKRPFVCDDMRYPNELEAFQQRGFLIVRLEVAKMDQLKRIQQLYPGMSEEQHHHASETALDGKWSKFDLCVPYTVRTVEALHAWWNKFAAPRFQFKTEV